MCQDTGTAIVMGKKGQHVLTSGDDEEAIARGVLRHVPHVEPALLADGAAHHVGRAEHGEQPAGADRARTPPTATPTSSCSWRRAAARPTRATSSRRRRRCSTRRASCASSTRSCARSAPRRARRTTSRSSSAARRAEYTLKVAKYASAHYLDTLPDHRQRARAAGSATSSSKQQILELTQQFGIGAQFGGKYFCHDVRVIRLPRHGASCPVGIAVSCSADRQALGKITADGVFLEELETRPGEVPARGDRRRPVGRRRAHRPQPSDGRDPRRRCRRCR